MKRGCERLFLSTLVIVLACHDDSYHRLRCNVSGEAVEEAGEVAGGLE
jgi:hypothetical protein